MANIKIRNLDSASDTQITSGIYLPSALNEEEGTQEKITVKATAAQIVSGGAVYADFSEGLMVSGVAVSTGSSAGSFEGGSFNFGSTDASNNTNTVNFNQGENVRMYIDESGGVNVSEKLIVADGKETVLGGVTTIKETLTVADGKETTLGGPVTIKGDSTFEQSAIFTTLSSDPAPPDGKLYRKGNDLYFGGQKILTEGQGGVWEDGTTAGQIYYSGGNVGIGTDSPVTALDINKEIGEASPIITLSRGGVSKSRFAIANATGSILDGSVTDDLCIRTEGGNIRFGTESAIKTDMSILSNGNVGIGTTDPGAKLEVDYTSANQIGLTLNGSNTALNNAIKLTDGSDNEILLSINAGKFGINGGDVGIGTNSPTARLDIWAPNASNAISVYNEVDNDRKMCVHHYDNGGVISLYNDGVAMISIDGRLGTPNDTYFNAGNVGIGTTNPGSLLDLGDSSRSDTVGDHSLRVDNVWGFRTSAYDNTADSCDLHIEKNVSNIWEAPVLSIKRSNGNVGIGIAVPPAKLSIKTETDANLIFSGVNGIGRIQSASDDFQTNTDLGLGVNGEALTIGGGATGSSNLGFVRVDRRFSLPRLDADPSNNPENGEMYYNTATNKFRGYQGGSWVNLA